MARSSVAGFGRSATGTGFVPRARPPSQARAPFRRVRQSDPEQPCQLAHRIIRFLGLRQPVHDSNLAGEGKGSATAADWPRRARPRPAGRGRARPGAPRRRYCPAAIAQRCVASSKVATRRGVDRHLDAAPLAGAQRHAGEAGEPAPKPLVLDVELRRVGPRARADVSRPRPTPSPARPAPAPRAANARSACRRARSRTETAAPSPGAGPTCSRCRRPRSRSRRRSAACRRAPGCPASLPHRSRSGAAIGSPRAGRVIGRRPEGSTRPSSTSAIASPPRAPGYQASSTACTLSSQGIDTGSPRLEHDDRVRIGGGDALDQLILAARQREVGRIARFGVPLLGEHPPPRLRRARGGGAAAAWSSPATNSTLAHGARARIPASGEEGS